MSALSQTEIPSWEFETKERSALAQALFPRQSSPLFSRRSSTPAVFDPSLANAYLDVERGLRRLVHRLSDYDADVFSQAV